MSIMCYRFTMKEARKSFFNAYQWIKINPNDPENKASFIRTWVNLQFAKNQERRG